MQSPKSLLAFGVGAVVAASTIAASPVAAESGLLRRQSSPSDGAATPANPTASDEASSAIAQNSSEQRLDRLQQQNEIRQQLNEAEFQAPNPGSAGINSLQLEQSVQQQINLQDLHNMRQEVGTTSSDSLDRLQFEQRVRQRLQQPNAPQSKVTIAQGNESATPAEAPEPSTPSALPTVAVESGLESPPTDHSEPTAPTNAEPPEAISEVANPEVANPEVAAAEVTPSETSETPAADATPAADTAKNSESTPTPPEAPTLEAAETAAPVEAEQAAMPGETETQSEPELEASEPELEAETEIAVPTEAETPEAVAETPAQPTSTRATRQSSNPYARSARRSRSAETAQNSTETVAPIAEAIAEPSIESAIEPSVESATEPSVDSAASPTETQAESVAQDSPAAPAVAAETSAPTPETPDALDSEPTATTPEITAAEQPAAETAQTEAPEGETEAIEEAEEITAAEQPAAETAQTEAPEGETEAIEEAEETEETEETESAEETDETDRPTAAPEKPNRTTEQAEDRIDRQNRDYLDDVEAPSPEYLDPDANPLSFPTLPEEVDLVGTQPITLQQAVELAIRNNPILQQERLQLERAQAALREAEASNYPTLDANATFNQRGQETFQEERQQLAPTNNPQQPLTTVTVPSETIYTDSTALGANLELSYPIYTSGRRPALIQAAQGQVRLQQLEVERQTEDLILNTTQDYYDLQQASAQVNIFTANLTEAEQSLRDAQALERAGVGTRFDVLQAEVDVANARQELTQQLSQLEIARRQLAQRLSLAESLNVEAGDVIEVAGVWELSLPETLVQAYKNRAELEQQLIQREIAQNNRRAALAQLGPQFFFNGSFGVTNDLDRDPGFLYNYQLGLTASLSLYDGGEARAQANQQESNIAIAESEFQNVRDQIRFQVEQAYSQLDSNFANIQTTALAVEQAAEALRLARLRFQAGVGTQTDVLRQQTALAQAQVNNLRAILDYNRAIASLQRQVSNYSEGLLNEQP